VIRDLVAGAADRGPDGCPQVGGERTRAPEGLARGGGDSAGDINNGMRYYYPSGHLLSLEQYYANQREEILYDNEGKPLFTYRERPGELLARWHDIEFALG